MSYIHIFTDSLDKLLSASIWYKGYGGNDAFGYYTDNQLHGYVLDSEYYRLSAEGGKLLRRKKFVSHLSATFQQLTAEMKVLTNQETTQSNQLERLAVLADLLKRCYFHYFYTEEYYTGGLSVDSDMELINTIGKLRLSFIDTCIQATENVYEIAKILTDSKDFLFYTIDELLKGAYNLDISKRKKYFLLSQKNQKLKLLEGEIALRTYTTLVDNKVSSSNILNGMGASVGKVTGIVYILKLGSTNLYQEIDEMPGDSILVTETTQPQLIMACKKAKAIITNEGGILSHAAIISRELGIPCVVGTRVATRVLQNGQFVEVDGAEGQIKLIK